MKIFEWSSHEKYAIYGSCSLIHKKLKNKTEEHRVHEHFFVNDPTDIFNWNPPKLCEYTYKGRKRKKGNSHGIIIGNAVVDQNMVDAIGNELKKYGLLLPVDIEDRDEQFFRYWVTNELDCIDKEKSSLGWTKTPKGEDVFVIEEPIFKEELFDGSLIFRVKNNISNTVYIKKGFIDFVKMHKLKGFEFIENGDYDNALQIG